MSVNSIVQLIYGVQAYAWGKRGPDSLVARLSGEMSSQDPRSELWVGAHPSLPSSLELNGKTITLQEFIAQDPERILGPLVTKEFGNSLPFLFKILSVGEALSIQAHPDKPTAERLHREKPEIYPDSNHKPEIGVALTEVQYLYGFREIAETAEFFVNYPNAASLLQLKDGDDGATNIRQALYRLFNEPQALVNKAVDEVIAGLRAGSSATPHGHVFLKAFEKYGYHDRGLLSIFLMNYEILKPGEAVYNKPHVLHAYLSGDLVECLANSDNVIRSALTPKTKDIDTLLEVVDFAPSQLERCQTMPDPSAAGFVTFVTPMREAALSVARGESKIEVKPRSAEILFSVDALGSVQDQTTTLSLVPGTALFVPADVTSYSVALREGSLFRSSVPDLSQSG